jgi:Cu(I)/Ag(I) efflux system membrane fusion protein
MLIREENHKYIWVEKSHGLFENVMVETGVKAKWNGRNHVGNG